VITTGRATAVRAAATAVVAVLFGVVLIGAPSPAFAGVTTNAEAIVQPGTLKPLDGGGSATPFGVALPAGAACPGDTAHGQFRVYSFLVPQGVPLTSVSYEGALPARWYGFIADGGYFGAVNTAERTGEIVGLPPAFTFSRLTPQELFTGGSGGRTWEGGIACVNSRGVVTDAWSSQFRFIRDGADPGGFRWAVQNATPVVPPSGNPWQWIGTALLVVALLSALGVLLLQRRSAKAEGEDGPVAIAAAEERRPRPRRARVAELKTGATPASPRPSTERVSGHGQAANDGPGDRSEGNADVEGMDESIPANPGRR
jgi:hypothetical protein